METGLTTAEIVAVGDENRSFEEAAQQLRNASGCLPKEELTFEHCLRIKNTLDRIEKQS